MGRPIGFYSPPGSGFLPIASPVETDKKRVMALSWLESIVTLGYHGNGAQTIRRLESICMMRRHIAMDDLVVFHRDKELVFTLHVTTIEFKEL